MATIWATLVAALGSLAGVATTGWSSLALPGQIAMVLAIVIGLFKSSVLSWLWDWVPANAKPWVAPVLGVLYALFATTPFTWSGILAGFGSGMLASALSQLVPLIAQIPGLGSGWTMVISLIESILGGGSTPPPTPPATT